MARAASAESLALHGGSPAKGTPYRTGRRFGSDELRELRQALAQNTLFYAKGRKVRQFCADLAGRYGMKHAVATSSGTAAIHVALAAVGVTLGDEVVTSVLTDAGSFIGILMQNAVPVFADVDPLTYNLTAETIAARLTPRTKAILVVHLAGSAADMDPILKLARERQLFVIEDCAQSWNATYKGRFVGTLGDVGCFSLNDFKHLSVGDGGAVVTNDDAVAARAALYTDKWYPRGLTGQRTGNICEFLGFNYRMSELAGAVACAQLRKLDRICDRRTSHGRLLTDLLADAPGILPPRPLPDCESSSWYYMFRIDEELLGVGRDEFAKALTAEGVPASFYLRRVDRYPMFLNLTIHPPVAARTGLPAEFACPYDCPAYRQRVDYSQNHCPGVEAVLRTAVIFQMSEFHSVRDIRDTARAIRKVAAWYQAAKVR